MILKRDDPLSPFSFHFGSEKKNENDQELYDSDDDEEEIYDTDDEQ